MSSSPKIRSGEKIDHYETVRQRKDGARLTISLTVSPIRDENGVIVGASKVARDITERARLLASAREHAANSERLGEVGSVVTSTLDRDVIVQKVTDVATALTHAQFGAFFYNVTDPAVRRRVHAVHAVRRPARSLCEISAPARHGGLRPDVSWRRARAPGRRDSGSSATERCRPTSACRRDICPSAATWRCR